MKLKTVRVRRSRPSALSLALALMLTMLFVYLLSFSVGDRETGDAASAQAAGSAELRMEGMSAAFSVELRCEALLEARIEAAKCAERGGAGLILADGDQYAVIREAHPGDAAPEDALLRSANGLTLRLSGPAGEIRALSDAVSFLRAQAAETGSLAAALEDGSTDAASVAALLRIYRTQGAQAQSGLESLESDVPAARLIQEAVQSALSRLDAALAETDPGRLRLVHAAGCAEWLHLLTALAA